MNENLAEVQKIANNSAAPTFENTIVELERSGQHTRSRRHNLWRLGRDDGLA